MNFLMDTIPKLIDEEKFEEIDKIGHDLISNNSNLIILFGFLTLCKPIKEKIKTYSIIIDCCKKIGSEIGYKEKQIKFLLAKF